MSYETFITCPVYADAERDADGKVIARTDGVPLWSGDTPPPRLGERIMVTMNACGPAIVTGYFVQGGWLGILCDLEQAPYWHRKQNKNDPRGHVFGAEMRRMPKGETWQRPLYDIAREISGEWENMYFGAVPYVEAMSRLKRITEPYGADSGKSIVLYFLANARTWRGDTARRVKAELKALAGVK